MELDKENDQTESAEVTRPVVSEGDGENSNFPITNTHPAIDLEGTYKKKSDGVLVDQFASKLTIEYENIERDKSEVINDKMKYTSTQEDGKIKEEITVTGYVKDAPLTFVDADDGPMKLLGKLCGVKKERLVNEDFEPFTNPAEKRNHLEENQQRNRSLYYDESVGERLAFQGNDTVVASHVVQAAKQGRENVTANNESIRVHSELQFKQIHGKGEQEPKQEKQRLFKKRSETGSHDVRKGSYPDQTNAQKFPLTRHMVPDIAHALSDDVYNFSHSIRGYMLVIVNEFAGQSRRDGAHLDLEKMRGISRKFGFRSLNYNEELNRTQSETLRLLNRAKNMDHSDCDCFLFCISTHGLEQRNALMGGQVDHALVCSDDQLILTSTILDMFNETNCPTLKGKPKLFFIQACRGDKLDHGGNVLVAEKRNEDKPCGDAEPNRRMRKSSDVSDTRGGSDSWASNPFGQSSNLPPRTGHSSSTRSFPIPSSGQQQASHQVIYARPLHEQPSSRQQPLFMVPQTTPGQLPQYRTHAPSAQGRVPSRINVPTPYAIVDTPSLKCDNDMLVMYAIPPGMFAWRNMSQGSWMIDYLHEVLMDYDMRRPKNFLHLMTKVSKLMSLRTTNTPTDPEMHGKTAVSVIEHKLDKDIIFQQKVPCLRLGQEV